MKEKKRKVNAFQTSSQEPPQAAAWSTQDQKLRPISDLTMPKSYAKQYADADCTRTCKWAFD